MKMEKMNFNKILNCGFHLAVLIGIVLFTYNAFTKYFLGYDEAGQFYIAKGLCHYSLPYSEYSGLSDVIFYNRYFNLDPGGYSILLHYWTMISNHFIWMRLLSLTFFFVAIGLIYRIGLKLFGKDKLFAVLLVSVFFIVSPFGFISALIRAYSMEMLGIALSLIYLLKTRKTLKTKELVALACIHIIFMTSRYDFVVYSLAVFACVVGLLIKRNGIKQNYIKISVFGSIMLLGAIFVFFLSMHYQNSRATVMPYMPYIGSDYKLLWSWMSLRYYIILVSSGYILWRNKDVDFILVFSIIVNSLFFVLSIANYFPWDSWKTLSVTITQYIAIVVIFNKILSINFIMRKMFSSIYIVIFLLLIFNNDIYPTLREQYAFEELSEFKNQIGEGKQIYVCNLMNPDIRYQYEEGIYKEKMARPYNEGLLLASDISHALTNWVIIGDYIKPEDANCDWYLLVSQKEGDLKNYSPVSKYKYIFTKKKNSVVSKCTSTDMFQ